jgi:hypothetical protein
MSLKTWWKGLFSSRPTSAEPKENPEEVEVMPKCNVGVAIVVVKYLDVNDRLVSAEAFIYGSARMWADDCNVHVQGARSQFNQWMKCSVTYGFLDLYGHKMIPRERVREIFVTFKDHYAEIVDND